MKTILTACTALALCAFVGAGTPASAAFVPDGVSQPAATTTSGIQLAHRRHSACRNYNGWHYHTGYNYVWTACQPPYSGGYHGGGGGSYGGGY